jgi:flagella basal body P-ring formation protein FlgA
VLTVTRTILPKEKISEADLDFTYFNKSRLYNGYFKDKSEVVGETVSHAITAGTILNKKNIQSPVIVAKNQTITLIAQRHSIAISMQGIAKSDGALNTTIKVYNPSSQKTVDAVVIGPSKAQVI